MRIPTLSPNAPGDEPMVQPPSVTVAEDSTQNNTLFKDDAEDNIGSLYYVVAVIFIYGFSIVLMIASHIRKNQQDNQLRTYLKEMALLRKKDRREKILGRMTTLLGATNTVCSNLHNVVSEPGMLTSNISSGQTLVGSGNESIGRTQQSVSAGCTFAPMNIASSCPYGIHTVINVGHNSSNINLQSATYGQYSKNSPRSFFHDCAANCSNQPLVPAAQPPAINGSSAYQSGFTCNMMPVASFTTAATITTSNNNCSTPSSSSSSSSSSNPSSVFTTAITAIDNTPVVSFTTPDSISTTVTASTSTCDSTDNMTGNEVSFAKCQQQQHYLNNHPKIDEAQEIRLLQAQLTQIQLNQKQQQPLNNCCLDSSE